MDIREMVANAHLNALTKGFWTDVQDLQSMPVYFNNPGVSLTPEEINAIGNRLMLIVGEVAEAQEALRHNDIENFREELADIAIRLGDLSGGLGINLDDEIRIKMERNKKRPYKHNKIF